MDLRWISFFFFALAGLFHIGFFVFESIILQKKGAHTKLKISEEAHQAIKIWAFNQGFYNLFLAIGMFVGLGLVISKNQVAVAGAVTSFAGFFMIAAGVVLWFSAPRLRKGALLQIIPPLLGFLFLISHIKGNL